MLFYSLRRDEQVRSAMALFNGSWPGPVLRFSAGDRVGLPVDLVDLSSHDLCAYAQGPHQVVVGARGAGWRSSIAGC